MTVGIEAGQSLLVVVLVATALAFLARKTRQPTIIAYALTGIILGPVFLDAVTKTELTTFLSELGLALLLFLIGLEIDIEDVREIIRPTLLIAVGQMAATGALGYIVASLLGFALVESLFVGAAAAFSSTAVVVKLLTDKDEITSLPGKLDVGILLIQDVVVVVLLAVMNTEARTLGKVALHLGEVAALISLVGLVSLASSRYLLPRLFKKISGNQHAFFIHGVAWAFLLISLTAYLGISREIGAFIAGVSLGQLPYSSELRERVRPLTDFFMAIFFINFGLGLAPSITASVTEALLAAAVLIVGKFVIMFSLIDRANFTPETSFKASINMVQTSEFSLILAAVALSAGFIGQGTAGFISMVALLTMSVSSYIITYSEPLHSRFEHLLERFESDEKQDFEVRELEDHALVIGYDELAKKVLEVLEQHYEQVVVVDRNSDNTQELATSDYEYIYGDFKHGEIRKASAVKDAGLVMSFSPEVWVNRKILEETDDDATVFVKTDKIEDAAELYELGAHYVIIKNILTADKMEEYLKLYLEDRELFQEEVSQEKHNIRWGGRK
ncbi:MAG: cation:proton antiporter [Candidatus Nanohaloarchaea archaeon]